MKAGTQLVFAQSAAGAGPSASHAETQAAVLHGIGAHPDKVLFGQETGFVNSLQYDLNYFQCNMKYNVFHSE